MSGISAGVYGRKFRGKKGEPSTWKAYDKGLLNSLKKLGIPEKRAQSIVNREQQIAEHHTMAQIKRALGLKNKTVTRLLPQYGKTKKFTNMSVDEIYNRWLNLKSTKKLKNQSSSSKSFNNYLMKHGSLDAIREMQGIYAEGEGEGDGGLLAYGEGGMLAGVRRRRAPKRRAPKRRTVRYY